MNSKIVIDAEFEWPKLSKFQNIKHKTNSLKKFINILKKI